MTSRNPDFLRKALAIFYRTLNRHYEYKARIHNLKNPKAGAITVVQRFGGALNLNVHFHTIYIDVVFFENNFHTLRACFATHVLASGAEPTQVMKMGGRADFKTFQIYVRMAGVDVKGVTDNLKVMPKLFDDENVLKIR